MYQNNERPTAFISVNKGRRKVKEGKFVYLQNGQEFEIELYNPTTQVVMAKIEMNGISISSSGIVLRPGERVYLERFLDNSNKFKFDTYEVSGGNDEVKKAIEKNGMVKVEFYNEDNTIAIVNTYNGPNIRANDYPYTHDSNIFHTNNVFGVTTSDISYNAGVSSTLTGGLGADDMKTLGLASMDSLRSSQPLESKSERIIKRLKSKSKKIETGRVEQGEVSNQTFDTVDKKFYSYTTNVVEYQIQPISQMRMTGKEAVKSSKYCTNCGKKAHYKNKFCANCGSKL